jgi:hypothetical protein
MSLIHSKAFNNLTRVHQRALHELYLTRHSLLDKLSEETFAFLAEHPEIVREEFGILFDRDPFDFRDSNVLFNCPIDRAVSEILSKTPPPDYSSDSDNWFLTVEEMSSSESKKKQNKSKKVKDKSEDSENPANPDDSNDYDDDGNDINNPPENTLDDQEFYGPKVLPSGQRGFNGQLTGGNLENSVYVSNTPKVRLEDSQIITHELIKKFVAQIRRGDFKGTIESLVDSLVWDKIF